MADFKAAINEAILAAKRKAIITRIAMWIESAETVDIVRESPAMKRNGVTCLSSMSPTGELTIELIFTGLKNLNVLGNPDADRQSENPLDYTVI